MKVINSNRGIRKMIPESQMKAVKKYMNKAYYRPSILLQREHEDALRAKAEKEGLTISSYIKKLILEDLEKEG